MASMFWTLAYPKNSSSAQTTIGTLPETNIAPENRPSQKETSIPAIHFQVLG